MIKDRVALSDWLIGTAVRLEYGDSGKSSGSFFLSNKDKNFLLQWKSSKIFQARK